MAEKNNYLDIHRDCLVCDTHCDTIQRVLDSGIDLGVKSDKGHIDIPRLFEGGVDAQVFACYIGRAGEPDGYYVKRALRMIDAFYSQLDKYPDKITPTLKADEIKQNSDKDKISAILSIEGGHAIEDDLTLLRDFYRLGVRLMTITWNSTNWADASRQPEEHNGLTDFGRDVIREMNNLGMMVDVSHSSDKTTWDVLETSKHPIIASHSCAKSLSEHPRNLNDDLIREITRKDGLICINFYSLFLDVNYESNPESKPPSFRKIIDHIDHIINLGGVDCVGLGSDFDGMGPAPVGMEDVTKMPMITKELLERGYSVEDVKKIIGGNFIRLFGEVCGD
ncbi:membrane dipeptidase [Candidatus Poribacteria bacterium]|nr:membrane dipeptidase [Candidatus Poribacteria bacterium]